MFLAFSSMTSLALAGSSMEIMDWLSTLAVRLAIVLYCFLMAKTWRLVGRRNALLDSAQPRGMSLATLTNLTRG